MREKQPALAVYLNFLCFAFASSVSSPEINVPADWLSNTDNLGASSLYFTLHLLVVRVSFDGCVVIGAETCRIRL